MRRSLLILAAAILAAGAARAAAPSVADGAAAWERADYFEAVKIWRSLAGQGDADAQFNLGQAYRLGRGVPLDQAAAQDWFERAARQGHARAETSLGILLYESGNRTGGLRWLRSAADRGEPRAMLAYGAILFNGDDVPADPVRAYAYISRAAATGLAAASKVLAQLDESMAPSVREKGRALARRMAEAKPAPATAPAPPRARQPKQAKAQPPAPPAATRRASAGGWRIQLGAFSQRASAEALFRKLAAGSPLAGTEPILVVAGPLTRLQAGPFPDKAAAASACATLKSRGQACFVVPGR